MNSNFMVKVEDAKLPDVQKALKGAGIKVRSIIQVYKEETDEPGASGDSEEKEGNGG